MNNQIRYSVEQSIRLLVTGKFADLATLTHGVRLTAKEMETAVTDYGRKLVMPPEDGFKLMNIVEVKNARPTRWSIAMPLWSLEEGRSDLTLEMTVVEEENGCSVELDDIHVL